MQKTNIVNICCSVVAAFTLVGCGSSDPSEKDLTAAVQKAVDSSSVIEVTVESLKIQKPLDEGAKAGFVGVAYLLEPHKSIFEPVFQAQIGEVKYAFWKPVVLKGESVKGQANIKAEFFDDTWTYSVSGISGNFNYSQRNKLQTDVKDIVFDGKNLKKVTTGQVNISWPIKNKPFLREYVDGVLTDSKKIYDGYSKKIDAVDHVRTALYDKFKSKVNERKVMLANLTTEYDAADKNFRKNNRVKLDNGFGLCETKYRKLESEIKGNYKDEREGIESTYKAYSKKYTQDIRNLKKQKSTGGITKADFKTTYDSLKSAKDAAYKQYKADRDDSYKRKKEEGKRIVKISAECRADIKKEVAKGQGGIIVRPVDNKSVIAIKAEIDTIKAKYNRASDKAKPYILLRSQIRDAATNLDGFVGVTVYEK